MAMKTNHAILILTAAAVAVAAKVAPPANRVPVGSEQQSRAAVRREAVPARARFRGLVRVPAKKSADSAAEKSADESGKMSGVITGTGVK
jgi:hypothetical protein